MKKIVLSLFLLVGMLETQAQYGNEWITYGQKYYKIKIWQEGIYAIKYTDLQAAGLSSAQIAAIPVTGIQVFYRGNEIPIWVSASGSFGSADRIEFYGQPNDGKLDQKLYRKPEEQPHAFKSLYTDTAVYYLTWQNAVAGKRYQDVNNTNYSGMTAENYYMFNQFVPMYNTYQHGRTGIIYDEAQSSDYTKGEGWVGGAWRRQTNSTPSGFGYQTFDIQIPNIYVGGPDAELFSKVYGASNGTSATGSPYKHHLQINTKAKNAATAAWDTIMDTLFYFHGEIICKKPIANTRLSDSIFQVRYWGPNDQGLSVDNKYISHIEMNYPRTFDMKAKSTWSFSLRGNGSSDIYLNWSNCGSTAANSYFYDVENGYRCQSTNSGSTQQVILPGASADRKVFASDVASQLPLPAAPVAYTFSPINTAANYNYLIISHSKLASGANAYKTNREAAGYKVLVVYADSLYDHFHYGQHSPMALRNFCNYMVNVPAKKADYLLLIGKGIECNRLLSGGKHNGSFLAIDRVPTWGYPGTDILLSAGLDGNGYAPAFATGRLAADSVEQVTDYIKKMVKYEQELATSTSLWKKNVLHLCGGRTEQETQNLLYYMNLLKPLVAKDSFGGVVKTHAKYDAAPVTSTLKEAIQQDLKNGVGFLYYYGHGAADLLEINIGDYKEVDYTGNKMPVMMFAGCILGNSYSDKTFLGERWIFPESRNTTGAIAWIANTHYGFVSPLADYAQSYYKQLMKESYGKSIGLAQIEAIKNYQDSNDKYNEIHCKQIVIQGDPSVKLFSPAYPEYYVHRNSMWVSPNTVTSVADSFCLKIIIRNQGKALTDTIKVQVSQVLPNSQRIEHTPIFVPAPYNTDTITFWIDQRALNTKGTNRFTVHVNPNKFPDKYINENGRYGNNKDSFEFYMPGNGASIVFPYNYSLLNTSTAKLIATSVNQGAGKETFIFHLDTNYQFSSSYLDSQRVSSSGLATGSFNLLNKDTQVYYWRVRIDKPVAEGGSWQTASFTYIKNSGNGWALADIPQMLPSSTYRTIIDEAARTLDFATTSSNTYWMASAGRLAGSSGRLFRKNSGENFVIRDPAKGGGQIINGFGFIALNPVNENPLRLQNFWQYRYSYQTSNPLYYNVFTGWKGATLPFDTTPALYIFNTQVDSERAAMAVFINDSIPDGYRVMVIKGDNPGFSKWSNSDFDLFKKIGGSGIIKKVGEDWPYTLKGTKGQPGKGRELTADITNPIFTPDRQGVKDYEQLGPRFLEGYLQSEMAGPAKTWTKFYKQHIGYDDPQDTAWYSLVFIDKLGGENELFSNITDDSLDISGVDASLYPWLKVRMNVRDSGQTRSPLQPNYWIVNYQGVPEGTVLIGAKAPFVVNPKDTISEGDSAFYKYGFTNISQSDMDSVLVEVKLTDHLNNVTTLISRKLEPMPANDTVFIEGSIDTKPYPAGNTLTVTFNPGFAQPEQYNYNNTYQAKFFCKRDFENPMLDVVFDGVRIFDGDIVSANPVINISATDENKNFLITNPDNVKLYITYPKQAEQEITSASPDFAFSAADPKTRKATVTFTPKALPDGKYKLRAQAYDVAGNAAGSGSYEVQFNVVNKSMISRFYPYPNPFSTKAKFVFTLTGNEVPDQMRIRIMTVSGQVVKEIMKEELGPIHIGNNITQYAWDGTDEFGDKLANGVYLYQVTARLNGKDIDLNTETDPSLAANEQFFKKGIGKIVILR